MNEKLMTRPLKLVFLSVLGSMVSFYLLLSVVPLYAASVGSGGVGAGLATGALMLSTVAAEFITPGLVARFGHRRVLAAGLVLLGAPALLFPLASSLSVILVICLVRGVGFAIVVTVNGALVATLVPPERRGEGLGLFGIMAGLPGVLALPLGVWLVDWIGYTPVFVAGGLVSLAAVTVVSGIPHRDPEPEEGHLGVVAGLRTAALVRPAIVFAATAMAGGIVVTFLPAAAPAASGGLVGIALLAHSATATLARWWAGRHGDRHGTAGLLAPSLLAAATGIALLVLVSSPAAVLVGMLLFGAGFGVAQNASLNQMYDNVSPSAYGTVSALWNMAYDSGYGVGAAGFGVLAAQTGYATAFALTALFMLAALPLALRRAGVARRAVPAQAA